MAEDIKKILIIKLGALGDFMQALGPMKAIRAHHPDADITLLTTELFSSIARSCGYIDHIWIDERPKWTQIKKLAAFKHKLNQAEFDRVYDLQNNDRTTSYFHLLKNKSKPEWVGHTRGASHANTSAERVKGHAFDGHIQTLALAGIENIEADDLSWVKNDISHLGLKERFVLIAPGSSPAHPEKRWPIKNYAAIARTLLGWEFIPVVIGTQQEHELGEAIKKDYPETINLCGKTAILDLAVLGRQAAAAIGNDSGPMHIIGQTGCPSYVLFSKHSNPVKHRPVGPFVYTLQEDNLAELSLQDVLAVFKMRGFKRDENYESTV